MNLDLKGKKGSPKRRARSAASPARSPATAWRVSGGSSGEKAGPDAVLGCAEVGGEEGGARTAFHGIIFLNHPAVSAF